MIEKTKHILVVDDDPAVCQLVAEVFKTSEFEVVEAKDGIEALTRIDAACASIDVLLVDMVMPRLNGAELARVILTCHPAIKIIFMSEHPDDITVCNGIPASKLRYLKKPFTPEILELMVRNELENGIDLSVCDNGAFITEKTH